MGRTIIATQMEVPIIRAVVASRPIPLRMGMCISAKCVKAASLMLGCGGVRFEIDGDGGIGRW